jgi:cytidylate kinase
VLIAIDGPAGAGKSTVARAVADALGFTYLDSGAMYRCVALAELRGAEDPVECAIGLGDRIMLDGEDVTDAIRTPEVSARASQVAARPEVRGQLVARQRELIRSGDDVAEGRDIGTVVAPGALVKVYLVADRDERAKRRMSDRPGIGADALATDLKFRDDYDAARMQPAEDAQQIDTTDLKVEDVVEQIEQLVRARSVA